MNAIPIIKQYIPLEKRGKINSNIISCLAKKIEIPPEIIYNTYTGIGGLHGLKQSDFANYHEYSKAKKEIEMGQFFTPHFICKTMVELIEPDFYDSVIDMCCGMGNFFNHLPNQSNCYGFDIDQNAVSVAQYLYPQAQISKCDIRAYNPDMLFDYVIGNPPFNLDFDGKQSQFYYMEKTSQILKPTGILLFIVPVSFINSEFWEKTKVTSINEDFSFIGQTKLDDNAFSSTGVERFETKIMAFMRFSNHIEMKPYNADEFISITELKTRIDNAKNIRNEVKHQVHLETRELTSEETIRNEYKLKKYLYEIKTHKTLQGYYPKAIRLVTKLKTQRPPENCNQQEYAKWESRKLTYPKVFKVLKEKIHKQNGIDRSKTTVLERTRNKEIALVRTKYGYKLKAYVPGLLYKFKKVYTPFYDLILDSTPLLEPPKWTAKLRQQYKSAIKEITKKRREFEKQNIPFDDLPHDPAIDRYIDSLTFFNKDLEECRFTTMQKQDMGLIFQKRYSLLNWEQGCGKTAVGFHYGKYMMDQHKVRNVIILAPAIAVNLTWIPYLNRNNTPYRFVNSWMDFEDIPQGYFLVFSISMLDKLKRNIKRFMKMNSQKVCILFDESDEITNPKADRTEVTLDCFRRAKYKLLTTGTTTRNNINELYCQLILLYNNSVNMMCFCTETYYQNKEKDIEEEDNPFYGQPFPARYGVKLFRECFCPTKASVFGIEKMNQDIYNKQHLWNIISKTIITRKFKELAGDKYEIITHTVKPSPGEYEVYKKILQEFCEICYIFFTSTGDTRKEAALKLIRQIQLLIKACSVPNMMPGYFGSHFPRKSHYIERLINKIEGKVCIGCITLKALSMYEDYLRKTCPDRPIFIIKGDVSFKKREKIISQFEATPNGLLICTQQSLKSSANIPSCNEVIMESLQWNVPKMAQFYFRFIRLDSKENTNVHFVTLKDSIEQNLMALVLTKERLNEFIKSGEVKEQSDIFDEFDISLSLIESLLRREQDDEGKFYITWGSQKIV